MSADQTTRRIDYVPLDELRVDPRNPKGHADSDIDASIDRFGYTEPVMVDERTGLLVAGHGRRSRLIAMRDRGATPPAGVMVDSDGGWTVPVVRGWSSADDNEAAAYLIASNRLTEKGGWETEPLTDLLSELTAGPGLHGVGFTVGDVDDLMASVSSNGDSGLDPAGDPTDRGSVLKQMNVLYGEPQHQPQIGEVWNVGRHRLVMADLQRQHPMWIPFLTPDVWFVPFPSPYLLLSERADRMVCLAIHSDTFLAGHVLDKFAAVRGESSVELVDT